MTIHTIELVEFYDNSEPGESTLVGMEQAVPWESRHIPLTNQTLFDNALKQAIELRQSELQYLIGLRMIARHVDFYTLRADATERGSLTACVEEFWKGYNED